jgi:hypothetical protein
MKSINVFVVQQLQQIDLSQWTFSKAATQHSAVHM